jgi:hypothetical protein
MSDNVNLSKKLVTYEAMSVYDECIKQFIENASALNPVSHSSSLDTITVNPNTCNIWTRPNSNTSCTLDINLHTVNSKTILSAEVLLTISNTKPDNVIFNTNDIDTYWLNGNLPVYDVNKIYKIHIEYIDNKYFCSYEEYPLTLTNKFSLTPITAVSFNIKTAFSEQELSVEQRWDNRKDNLLSFLHGDIANANKYTMPKADIIGLQEIWMDGGTQWNDIKAKFTEYNSIIANRGSSSALIKDSEACAILYRKDRFTRISGGYFWLRGGGWNGDTGNFNEEGKATWDAGKSYSNNYKRIAVWVILREIESGKQIFVLNTHYNTYFLDDGKTPASTPYYSSEVIKNRIDALSGSYPTIFMGDLHCNPDKSAIQILKPNYYSLRDTRDEAAEILGEEYTMNDWDSDAVKIKVNDNYEYHSVPTYALFDYIMVKDGGYGTTGKTGELLGGMKWTVNQHIVPLAVIPVIHPNKINWVSDHNPVVADLYLE